MSINFLKTEIHLDTKCIFHFHTVYTSDWAATRGFFFFCPNTNTQTCVHICQLCVLCFHMTLFHPDQCLCPTDPKLKSCGLLPWLSLFETRGINLCLAWERDRKIEKMRQRSKTRGKRCRKNKEWERNPMSNEISQSDNNKQRARDTAVSINPPKCDVLFFPPPKFSAPQGV